VIVVYAITLDLDGPDAEAAADRRITALAEELDPGSALVVRSVSDRRPRYRAAGLLHDGTPRLTDQPSRYEQ
jgi:hypothetical protein